MQSNRRQFLKTGLFSAAAAVAGTSICAQAAQAPRRWDKTADIVIVGFGGAGAVGAISAAQAGSSVLILEKNEEASHLNNTRMSGGNCHCPEKTGNKDALKAYCIAMFSGENIPGHLEGEQAEWSERLADIWVKYCPDNMDFMRSLDPDFSAKDYKHCSFVISDKHLELQRIKGLKDLNFRPFFLSVAVLQHAYKIT